MKLEKIILDTDIGFDADDALALGLCLRSPEIQLEAITTVYEFTELKKAITHELLDLAQADPVPIYAGVDYRDPSVPSSLIPDEVFLHMRTENDSHEGKAFFDEATIAQLKATAPRGDAIRMQYEIIMKNPGEISIVAIGPLTNIGSLLKTYPDVKPHIKHIYFMGGVLDLSVQKHGKPSYNIRADPCAAKVVFESGVPLTCVPTDLTKSFSIATREFDMLAAGDAFTQKLLEHTYNWNTYNKKPTTYVHDPLTIGYILNQELFTTQSFTAHSICVQTGHMQWEQTPSHITVCRAVQNDVFVADFIKRLLP